MKPFSIFGLIGAIIVMMLTLAFVFQPGHLAGGIESRGNTFGGMLTRVLNNNADIFAILIFFIFMGVVIMALRRAGGSSGKGE